MPGPLNRRGLSVGQLRHRVEIQAATESLNQYREAVQVWAATGPAVWARVESVGGREFERSGGNQANVTHRALLRFRPGLTPKMRLRWLRAADYGGDAVLNIVSIEPTVGDANYLTVQCVMEA